MDSKMFLKEDVLGFGFRLECPMWDLPSTSTNIPSNKLNKTENKVRRLCFGPNDTYTVVQFHYESKSISCKPILRMKNYFNSAMIGSYLGVRQFDYKLFLLLKLNSLRNLNGRQYLDDQHIYF